MSNVEALRTVLEHVQGLAPGEWRQDEWSNCFAGHTVRLLAGGTEVRSSCPCGCPCALELEGERLYGWHIGVKAAQLLDLTPLQAERLFHATNKLPDLARLVGEFAAEEAMAPELALTA